MSGGQAPGGPVFVTGGTGFIGRPLVRALLATGRPVCALCRDPRAADDLAHPLLGIVQGDMENEAAWKARLREGMTVFHLAAVRAFAGTPAERFRAVNEEATLALGREALWAGVRRFVYISSALAYGPSPPGGRLAEATPVLGEGLASHYLQSRVRALRRMTALAAEGLPVVTICPSHVYGPDHPHSPNRLTSQIRYLLANRVDVLIGGGRSRRSLVHVEDVVRGLLLAERHGVPGESYILAGEDASHREFDRLVLNLAGKRSPLFLPVPSSLALPAARLADRLRGFDRGSGYASALEVLRAEWCYDSGKAARCLGYSPMSLAEGLELTLRWLEASPPAAGRD